MGGDKGEVKGQCVSVDKRVRLRVELRGGIE